MPKTGSTAEARPTVPAAHAASRTAPLRHGAETLSLDRLRSEFREILGIEAPGPGKLLAQAEAVLSSLRHAPPRPADARRADLLAQVNSKFDINADRIADLYGWMAKRGIVFNYAEKRRIKESYDGVDALGFREILKAKGGPGRSSSNPLRTSRAC